MLLQVFIEQVYWQWCVDSVLNQSFQIVGVARQFTDCASLIFDKFFLQIVSNLHIGRNNTKKIPNLKSMPNKTSKRWQFSSAKLLHQQNQSKNKKISYLSIVMCFVIGMWVSFMQAVCFQSQCFFCIQCQCQCIDFIQFQNTFLLGAYSISVSHREIMCTTALCDVFYQINWTLERFVWQCTELFLETWTIFNVSTKVSGQQKVIVWTDQLFVCISLQMLNIWWETRKVGITIC